MTSEFRIQSSEPAPTLSLQAIIAINHSLCQHKNNKKWEKKQENKKKSGNQIKTDKNRSGS